MKLQPMRTAPKDGTEILAYHEAKNFHPVKYKNGAWSMRWHDEYHQCDGNYFGWIPMPTVEVFQ